jgi:uncharacterized protein YraI
MTMTRLVISAAAFVTLSAACASAAPAYVLSTVNLRSAAGTNNEILAKIPGGSLVDAGACTNGWCEVTWQGKSGFAVVTALDLSGRVPGRAAGPRRIPGEYTVVQPAPMMVAPGPAVVVAPGPYYYGYRYGYGYRPYWGYRGYYRRW